MSRSRLIAKSVTATVRAAWFWLALTSLGGLASGKPPALSNVPETVRRDWYFRESLTAIRDWEAILAWWEQQTPAAERTPVLPVPVNGDAVEWPNPIPAMLLPTLDGKRRVVVRASRSQIEIERIDSAGGRSQQTTAPARPSPDTSILAAGRRINGSTATSDGLTE